MTLARVMPVFYLLFMLKSQRKTPYALLVNDIHVNTNTLDDFRYNWEEALKVCEGYHINHIIIGGDLWTSRASQTLDALMAVDAALTRASSKHITIDIADGNHDKVDQEAYISYNRIFRHINNVNHIQTSKSFELDNGLFLLVMSYFPESTTFLKEMEQAVGNCFASSRENIILYIHQGINGALGSSNAKELAAGVFKGFRQVLVGHYHDRSKLGDNIMYIGSSRQHNFGEDESKGYTIIYTDGTTKFIENQVNLRYRTIEVTPDEIGSLKAEVADLVDDGYKVKVRVTTDNANAKTVDRQKLVDMGVTKVEVVTETPLTEAHNANFNTKFDKAGLKQEYQTFCAQKEITDVQTGFIYLDKIN